MSRTLVSTLSLCVLSGILGLDAMPCAEADLTPQQRADIVVAKGSLVQTMNNMDNALGHGGGSEATRRMKRTKKIADREWKKLQEVLK